MYYTHRKEYRNHRTVISSLNASNLTDLNKYKTGFMLSPTTFSHCGHVNNIHNGPYSVFTEIVRRALEQNSQEYEQNRTNKLLQFSQKQKRFFL